jgi:hypothetical protein
MKKLLILIATVLLSGLASSDELPTLRPGMWDFNRTVTPAGGKAQTLQKKECADPTGQMKNQNAMFERAGCTFSPVQKSGNRYTFKATCTVQGETFESTTVMTVENEGAYRLDIESRHGKQATRETLAARRVGDCPK